MSKLVNNGILPVLHGGRRMSFNHHSIPAISAVKKLQTPVKASVVILTTVILASCSTSGSDSTVTPKSSPVIGSESGENVGSGGNVSNADAVKAIKAAEAKTKAAQEALKVAEAKTKAAQDALKAAQESFGKESEKVMAASKTAIDAAKDEAAKAKLAAEAARVEAITKIEAAAKASKTEITAAKKSAADAVAKVKEAEEKAKAADNRATVAEAKAKEIETSLKAAEEAKTQAEKQATAAKTQAALEKQKADKAQGEADKAKADLLKATDDLAAAEKALAAALASGGNTEALQAEVERRQVALDAANAQAAAAQQAQAAASAQAAAQVTAAQAAAQAAKDALAAATIKNAPEAEKSGVQSLNINAGSLGVFNTTTRDFDISADGSTVDARADIASQDPSTPDQPGLLPKVAIVTSGANDTETQSGFKTYEGDTEIIVAAIGQTLPLNYTSTYKDFGDDMRIGHIDGAAEVALLGSTLPVNGIVVTGNATQAANIPTEGKVGYTGDATYRELGLGNDIEFGKSVFTADFVAKNVKGDLTFDKAGKIGLTASINGNQFSGTAANNAGYTTEGGFFGGDAQYLGGVYAGNNAQGTYGATSDKQTAAKQSAKNAQAAAATANAAIANAQAQANAAKAAADKAKADAVKAQEALQRAEDALANAGNGEKQLAAALERASAAEMAEAAALQALSTAEAARKAAETAKDAALQAAQAAQNAADKAIGEAKVEADKKVAEANQQAADATAQAAAAQTRADEALQAKADAEARAKAAEEALEASQQLPPAPTNPQSPVNATISGFQNTISGSDNSAINTNTSANYDTLNVNLLETGSGRFDKNTTTNFKLRDASDEDYEAGFKRSALYSLPAGYLNRRFKYTSVYKNYNDQMQIGHLYGDFKTTNNGIRLDTLSNVYVQGNSTSTDDMQYIKGLSQYNIDNGINDGKVAYKGDATYIGNSEQEIIGVNPIIGTSEFDVDFVDSQIDGTLSFEGSNVSEKEIKAEIIGNTFAGNWNGVDTKGGFFGEDAGLLGGVYQVSGGKGTYGASKVDPSAAPAPVESTMTGFQSTALSSKNKTLPLGQGQLVDAIGYVEIRDDKSAWTETNVKDGSNVPIDNRKGNNFNSFSKGKVLADMVKPDTVLKPIEVSLTNATGAVTVDAGRGNLNPSYQYSAVYENFDNQMQIGHVYGNLNSSFAGDVSRAANVYVQGYLTSQAGMDSLKGVNDGKAQYTGSATYIENIHLADNASTAPVNGTSAFNVDFVNGSVDGTLSFTGTDYKYMPAGNQIKIDADIAGNTFVGNKNGIDTAGGFYGEGAKFLGGIYQDVSDQGGKGTAAGTGTKFQGTFGAAKQ